MNISAGLSCLLAVAAGAPSDHSASSSFMSEVHQILAGEYEATPLSVRKNLTMKISWVDLNGDGSKEAVVYVEGACGSGGCDLYILNKNHGHYKIMTVVGLSHLPVRMLRTSAHGWHDLGVTVAGGGIRRSYEAVLSFDGHSYPENPTVPPARKSHQRGGGETLLSSATKSVALHNRGGD